MSYNSIAFFDLNLNTLTPADKFVMLAFTKEAYYTDIYQATDYAQRLISLGKTYCYRYVPLEPGLYNKIYDQNEIVDLAFIASWVMNPYTYDFTKPIYVNGRYIYVDEVDRSFIIVVKGREFYSNLFLALNNAQNFRGTGRFYCWYMKTPYWFPADQTFSVYYQGQQLLLLWYNQGYVLPKPLKSILDQFRKKE